MAAETFETNYLIVGAGAMGMAFLEEMILNSDTKECIIIDKRSGVGGHWRDSYDFVTLQCNAPVYGLNSSSLAPEGPELPTKYQILEHFERGLERLMKTDRVKFLGQVKYVGRNEDGSYKLASTLVDGLEYNVVVKDKLVDATRTENHVPATRPPQYKVAEGMTVIPVNGLAKIPEGPWSEYYVVGAGKTGLDATLYLLNRQVPPNKINMVLPNDCWFLDRETLNVPGNFSQILLKVFCDPELKDVTSHMHALEREGLLSRLSQDVEPTRFRGAVVAANEVERLRSVNIVRTGRFDRIEKDKIVFVNGETRPVTSSSLFIDCSSLSTLFDKALPIFEKERINLQYTTMPPNPGMAASTIAALDIKYPDEPDKKNDIFPVLDVPQTAVQLCSCLLIDMKARANINKELGFWWQQSRRNFIIHHLSWETVNKMLRGENAEQKEKMKAKLEMLVKSEGKNAEHTTSYR